MIANDDVCIDEVDRSSTKEIKLVSPIQQKKDRWLLQGIRFLVEGERLQQPLTFRL